MTLLVLMAGEGTRFKSAGYLHIKPLIRIGGKFSVKHLLDSFPKEKNIVFVCSLDQLGKSNLADALQTMNGDCKLVAIKAHKQGQLVSAREAYPQVPDNEEVFVTPIGLSLYWNPVEFRQKMKEQNADAAVLVVRGDHPAAEGSQAHGFVHTNGPVFMGLHDTAKPDDVVSTGMYWFKDGALMKNYFDKAFAASLKTGEEFWCGPALNLLAKEGKRVVVHEMQHIAQWGTPESLEQFEAWSRVFSLLCGKSATRPVTEIPAMREALVMARPDQRALHPKLFTTWHGYFSSAPWHPYFGSK
ncbi:NTP transferase domain-containing protein [Candidatus Woesearchaeota archaeon]|nr:NTP transferase domain-containing protein [Candidatus Woesearchaeota archaeon]